MDTHPPKVFLSLHSPIYTFMEMPGNWTTWFWRQKQLKKLEEAAEEGEAGGGEMRWSYWCWGAPLH